MTIGGFLHPKGFGGWFGLLIMGLLWLNVTIGILCLMEVRLLIVVTGIMPDDILGFVCVPARHEVALG